MGTVCSPMDLSVKYRLVLITAGRGPGTLVPMVKALGMEDGFIAWFISE